jgi:hypothetical protein
MGDIAKYYSDISQLFFIDEMFNNCTGMENCLEIRSKRLTSKIWKS